MIARRLTIGLIFGFLVFLLLALFADIRQVSNRIYGFRWQLYPLVLLLTLFNYTLRFFKWHFYIRELGATQLSWQHSANLFVGGFPLAVTPGKVGEVLKGVWLNNASGIPVGQGVSVVVAERISDGLAVMVLSTLGVIAYPQYWPVFLSLLAVLLGIISLSQIRPLAEGLLGFATTLPFVSRLAPALREFYEGSFALFQPRTTLIAVTLGTISWLGEGLGMYLILLGLGVEPGWKVLSIAVFALSFSIVIGAASALPGGLGVAEASIAGMLVLLLGLDVDLSATATLLIRFATLWFGVSLGLLAWLRNPTRFRLGEQRL